MVYPAVEVVAGCVHDLPGAVLAALCGLRKRWLQRERAKKSVLGLALLDGAVEHH